MNSILWVSHNQLVKVHKENETKYIKNDGISNRLPYNLRERNLFGYTKT